MTRIQPKKGRPLDAPATRANAPQAATPATDPGVPPGAGGAVVQQGVASSALRIMTRTQKEAQMSKAVMAADAELLRCLGPTPSEIDPVVLSEKIKEPLDKLIDAASALETHFPGSRKKVVSNRRLAVCLMQRIDVREVLFRSQYGEDRGASARVDVDVEKVLLEREIAIARDIRHVLALDCNVIENIPQLLQKKISNALGLKWHSGVDIIRGLTNSDTQKPRHEKVIEPVLRNCQRLWSVMMNYYHMHKNSDRYLPSNFNRTRGFDSEFEPVFVDIREICLDIVACGIDIDLPKYSEMHTIEEIGQLEEKLDAVIRYCSELANLIKDWQQDCAVPLKTSKKPQKAPKATTTPAPAGTASGHLTTVVGPMGIHLPAKIQADGTALTFGSEPSCYRQSSQGEFEWVDPEEIESDSDTEEVGDAAPNKSSKNIARALAKSQEILAKDIDKELSLVTAWKGNTHPDTVWRAYDLRAEKWQKQIPEINRLASKLSNFQPDSYETQAQRSESEQAARSLLERAAELESMVQTLTRPETRWSLLKSYGRPQASHWAKLLASGQIAQVSAVKALPSTPPNTVFEVCIQACPDADGTAYAPVWVHLHLKEDKSKSVPMTAGQVKAAKFERFVAVHLKSDVEKNRGPEWIAAQRAKGIDNPEVHRSEVGEGFFKALMKWSGKKAVPQARRPAEL
jgi:hypothetical protein